ncbi:hypothetical protein D3C85_1853600 [compost metagenome]
MRLEAGGRALLQFQGYTSAFIGFNGSDQNAGDFGVFVADRAVGQIKPEVGIDAVTLQGEPLLTVGSHLTL